MTQSLNPEWHEKPNKQSKILKTAAGTLVTYLATKYGVPEELLTPEITDIAATGIVAGGLGLIGYFRKFKTNTNLI